MSDPKEFTMPTEDLFDDVVRLRALRADDLEELYAVASDPLIWEQHPSNDRWKRDVFESFFEKALAGGYAFVIIDAEDGKLIGSSRYYDIGKQPDSVAIGYTFLARSHWGGIFNRSVKSLMLAYAFRFVGRVLLQVGTENIRSQKAVERLGAVKIAELPVDQDNDALRFEYAIYRPSA